MLLILCDSFASAVRFIEETTADLTCCGFGTAIKDLVEGDRAVATAGRGADRSGSRA